MAFSLASQVGDARYRSEGERELLTRRQKDVVILLHVCNQSPKTSRGGNKNCCKSGQIYKKLGSEISELVAAGIAKSSDLVKDDAMLLQPLKLLA